MKAESTRKSFSIETVLLFVLLKETVMHISQAALFGGAERADRGMPGVGVI